MRRNLPSPRRWIGRSPLRLMCLSLAISGLAISGLDISGDEATADEAGIAPRVKLDPQTALNEGNRLFRDGRIEEAVATYLTGTSPSAPHPTLLYNLGTALHHLDRLPEAILWYRRAAESDDPWLKENLWLARRSLGSQALPPGGSLGWISRHAGSLSWTAVALAWIALLLFVAGSRIPRWLLLTTALTATLLYTTATTVERWGPQPAVVLENCVTGAAELPAGTEAWVMPGSEGSWRVSGTADLTCPPDTVELIFPGS